MPFDLSSAQPVDDSGGGFDLSSAQPVGDEKKAPAAPKQPSGRNTFGSVIEPAMAMGSSMLAGPASDVAGLADIPAHFLGMSKTMPEDVKRKVQTALTYQPRTTMGQQVTQYNPLTLLGKGINAIGSKANELVAPPMTSGPFRVLPQVTRLKPGSMRFPCS